jgi:CO dehydrogenase maturation factor
MSEDMGIKNRYVIGNKISSPDDEEFLRREMPDYSFAGFLPGSAEVVEAERRGRALYESSLLMREGVEKIVGGLGW